MWALPSARMPQHLVHLAAMGSAMARVLFDIERPESGLAQYWRGGGERP